ncbi:four helix bundle protein [Alkalibacter saccharofermentans DSM 14828]|uniref:Four helix bundle protein n=1 Tax=Alkalibacter saccharofermentans DSM 14828 TaxID=1120975 RepID=A0A1M4UZX4_9FIRM|nr:four helix bundle protein [Alkalibacter saccharofermentans]SHE62198.1 four helix bundle protein [Alkalibacter saccharofermentans DSM 14828]
MENNFENLLVWQKSRDLTMVLYDIIDNFPDEEKYAMGSQLRRAVNSISANIAEGTGRGSNKDFANFLYFARGSLFETKNFIYC